MNCTVLIQNIGGIWYINQKRLGHDKLTDTEIAAIDNFIREFKNNQS